MLSVLRGEGSIAETARRERLGLIAAHNRNRLAKQLSEGGAARTPPRRRRDAADGANRTLVRVKGDHSLRGEHAVIADAIRAWSGRVLDLGSRTPPP